MLAKMTAKNQLTLPKSVTNALGPTEYFDVQTRDGQIILTPVTREYIHSLRGKYKGKGLMKSLMADKKREREL